MTLAGRMNIHALQTGTVEVRRRQLDGAGKGRARLLMTLADRQWTRPLPISAWAIEHPECVIVVHTGAIAARMSTERIRAYAVQTPMVYLPSYDPDSVRRLMEREIVGRVGERARQVGLSR